MTRYEPHCDCLGGHVSMLPDPNGRWCRADDPRAEDQDALTHLDLLDPVVVHLNMLRGRIAKLTDAQIRHLHPQLFAGTDPRAVADDPSGIVQQMPEGGDEELAPCPFCGGRAEFEAVKTAFGGTWSVGCQDADGDCYGYQSLQTFARKREAAVAWNRRATEADLRAEVERLRQALRPFAEVTILPTGAVVGLDRFWFDRARAALSPETDGGQDEK